MWLLLLACGRGCGSDSGDSASDSAAPPESPPLDDSEAPGPERFEGQGGGFGSRLAVGPEGVLVAAPWFEEHGEVYTLGEDAVLAGGVRSFGLGLASLDGELLVEAPTASAELHGSRLVVEDGLLLALELGGVHAGEDFLETPARPMSATLVQGRVVAGLVGGVWTEEGWIAEAEEGSELGLSICSADLNEDGQEDLAVGAPGADEVHVWLQLEGAPLVLEGEGRFGQALACEDGLLAVGAPLYEEAGGAWLLDGFEVAQPALIGEAGDRLGQDVLLVEGLLYAGAPGGADSPGAVVVAR